MRSSQRSDCGAVVGGARRLVTLNAAGLVFPLPLAYGNRIKALPGVTGLSWANWFGGRYGDGKNFFAQFAVDAPSYLELYPEIILPADQKQAFLQDRTGALIGKRLLSQFGWKLGQSVTLQGTIFQGDWTFTIRAVYTPTVRAFDDRTFYFLCLSFLAVAMLAALAFRRNRSGRVLIAARDERFNFPVGYFLFYISFEAFNLIKELRVHVKKVADILFLDLICIIQFIIGFGKSFIYVLRFLVGFEYCLLRKF